MSIDANENSVKQMWNAPEYQYMMGDLWTHICTCKVKQTEHLLYIESYSGATPNRATEIVTMCKEMCVAATSWQWHVSHCEMVGNVMLHLFEKRECSSTMLLIILCIVTYTFWIKKKNKWNTEKNNPCS